MRAMDDVAAGPMGSFLRKDHRRRTALETHPPVRAFHEGRDRQIPYACRGRSVRNRPYVLEEMTGVDLDPGRPRQFGPMTSAYSRHGRGGHARMGTHPPEEEGRP